MSDFARLTSPNSDMYGAYSKVFNIGQCMLRLKEKNLPLLRQREARPRALSMQDQSYDPSNLAPWEVERGKQVADLISAPTSHMRATS